MPGLLRDHLDDLSALINLTARARGVAPAYIEKDFWVTEVLRAATEPIEVESTDGTRHPVHTIFKGGTSLSRIYGLIERFSEDVDLLVGFPEAGEGVGAKDRVLKAIRDRVGVHLGLSPDKIAVEGSPTRGVKRNTRYHYPVFNYRPEGGISSGVLLEMGCRGGTFPIHTHPMRSMIAEHAINELGDTADTWAEFAAFDVEVLAPERTLFEKLAMLHDATTNIGDEPARLRLLKAGRHVYDVHQLLNAQQVKQALAATVTSGIQALCADIHEHSVQAEFPCTPRPSDGYGASPLVNPTPECREVLEAAYAATADLIYGPRPTLDECLDSIKAHSDYL